MRLRRELLPILLDDELTLDPLDDDDVDDDDVRRGPVFGVS